MVRLQPIEVLVRKNYLLFYSSTLIRPHGTVQIMCKIQRSVSTSHLSTAPSSPSPFSCFHAPPPSPTLISPYHAVPPSSPRALDYRHSAIVASVVSPPPIPAPPLYCLRRPRMLPLRRRPIRHLAVVGSPSTDPHPRLRIRRRPRFTSPLLIPADGSPSTDPRQDSRRRRRLPSPGRC